MLEEMLVYWLIALSIALGWVWWYKKRQYDQLKKELEQKIWEAKDAERKRIMQLWHDDLGNSLALLRFLIDHCPIKDHQAQQEIRGLLDHIQKRLRDIIRQEEYIPFDSSDEFRQLLQKWQRQLAQGGVLLKININEQVEFLRLPPTIRKHTYRILQEAITNTLKHSDATTIEVVVTQRAGFLVLSVEDNGKSVTGEQSLTIPQSIKSRLQLVNGKGTIARKNTSGILIEVTIPAI